ncbi:hypothetical protein ACFV5C_24195, partial [Streptomyces sp. NPDC059762]
MTTVLLVHGTGVREPGYSEGLERVRAGLGPARPDVTVTPCYWGGRAGSALRSGGLSVPGYGTGRDVADPGARGTDGGADEDVELWGLLYLDPLLELRLLAAESGGRTELAPGAVPPGEARAAAALGRGGGGARGRRGLASVSAGGAPRGRAANDDAALGGAVELGEDDAG